MTGFASVTVSSVLANTARVSAVDQEDLDGSNDLAIQKVTVHVRR